MSMLEVSVPELVKLLNEHGEATKEKYLEVGVAVSMAGSEGGFTFAVFNASDVSEGTKLFILKD